MAKEILRYNTILAEATGEIVEKKSRFICNLYHIEDETQAAAYIAALKKEHYQARHVCSAYVLGDSSEIIKYSDDGEPSGTAGRPMLDILKGRKLTYTLACVTRYFGGVLLGTGGLVRAYSDALNDGLSNASIEIMELRKTISITVDYNTHGKLKYSLPGLNAQVVDEIYTDKVTVSIAFPSDCEERVRNYLTELTGGKVQIEDRGLAYVKVEE